jgi:hypothetical protein
LALPLPQQLHPAPCFPRIDDDEPGAFALRSLVACARRVSAASVEARGAVRMTRGAAAAHSGHSDGISYSAIGRIWVNGPQWSQRYS